MPESEPTINEVDFCALIASAANGLIAQDPAAYPFHEARVEGYGVRGGRRKRKDLRFRDVHGRLVLCGEVKLPGDREGLSPYAEKFCQDAEQKASIEGIRYFFTWNVNTFVLWDRQLYDRPLLERRILRRPLQRTLTSREEVAREENLLFIKTHFLPDLLRDLADFISGRRRDWTPPDEIFIDSLNHRLDWPARKTSAFILEQADKSKVFDHAVQDWMRSQDWTYVRKPHEEWAKAVDNMAKTLVYVWANRVIFYKALRTRFPELPRLELRRNVKTPGDALTTFCRLFQRAVERSGDYEPLLMPEAKDWATGLVFQWPTALDAWRGMLHSIESVDFREVPSDVVGRIFQKLIGPEERHRFGQHFTGDDPVDLINVFCVREADDAVFDPACGSGSFLVRAYHRKQHLDPARTHLDLIGELFGCDIAAYPAHLATLNLAAREINDEANYPRVARRNFFDVVSGKPFCRVPDAANPDAELAVELPALDAVVGNPPYVRQEKVLKPDKKRFGEIAAAAWPDLHLSKRSDLHCYFWPAAARFLKPDGYFGFLTSSSWLDVEYGFALQGWILRHFKILAVMESAAEPWFADARVKTCVTILQRCDDEAARMANRVRFVRFARKLAGIIGVPPTAENEEARQAALEALRKRILSADDDRQDEDLRIIVKAQKDLWAEGVRAGTVLGNTPLVETPDDSENGETGEANGDDAEPPNGNGSDIFGNGLDAYRAGKWGRYVRAPDLYFDFMRRYGGRFVPLGEVASIRRGITSGCDAFFMPTDITAKVLAAHEADRDFRRHAGGAPRKDAESGKLRIIEAGDGSVHPIEAKCVAPELHNLMKVDRLGVRAADLDRVVLLVGGPLEKLKTQSPWAYRYIHYGSTVSFPSRKSGNVPIPKRSTCKARDPWYDLTGLVRPGIAFWPKIQKYRHIVPANDEHVIGNCNLYDVYSDSLTVQERKALLAVLNSTLVGFFKAFYGRFAGTETTLKTEIVDVNLLEVPDPRGIAPALAKRLADALDRIGQRVVGRLVEEQLMECHSPERARRLAAGPLVLAEELRQADRRELDDAVFELLGVRDQTERDELVKALHRETGLYFREGRVVELQAMENRAKAENGRFSVHDLVADIWDAAALEDALPLADWLARQPGCDADVAIPEDRPAALSNNPMFAPNSVYFGKARKIHGDYESRGQAELVVRLANLEVSGAVRVPTKMAACVKLLAVLDERLAKARARFTELAESRTGDERLQGQLVEVLERWFVLGREPRQEDEDAETAASE